MLLKIFNKIVKEGTLPYSFTNPILSETEAT
jgi:hypothetical protein